MIVKLIQRGEKVMVSWFIVIFSIIGILLILVYPKIIRIFLFGLIGYFTIFVNWYYGVFYIPLLLFMLYFKRRKERYG